MHARILQIIAWSMFFVCAVVHGAPGDVDPAFGYPRPQVLAPDSTNAIPLPDGFLVIKSRDFDKAGSNSTLELTRIDEDGQLVPAFGIGGKVSITLPGAVNVATAVKGLPDGSMLLAGFERKSGPVSDNLAAIARLDSSGRLDPTFGIGGVATFDVSGQLDRVGAIDVLADGHILAGVWSEVTRDPYGDCSTDRVSLMRLNADGSMPEVIYYRERNSFADNNSCRNTMTLQVMRDQQFYFGSAVEIVAFSSPESGAWRTVTPLGCCFAPFAVDPGLGPVWTYQSPYAGWLETAASLDARSGPKILFPEYWFSGLGIPGPRTAAPLAADGDRPGWFLGISSDGGIMGIAKLRQDGWLDTGWAGGSGMVRIEGAGRADVRANEGLANDIRLLSVRPGGETLVVVTADGVIERRFAKSGPAHGAIHFADGDVAASEASGAAQVRVRREGGADGAISVDYRTLDAGQGYDCAYDFCAQSGLDYVATSGRLDWGDGDASERVITIPIANDQQHERRESFHLQLTAPTGGAIIPYGGTWAIDIDDDDPASPGSDSGDHSRGGGGAIDWLLLALLVAGALVRSRVGAASERRSRALLLALAVLALAAPAAWGGVGDMDPTFGSGGVLRLDVIGPPLQDGRLLYRTSGGYGRTDVDGRVDASFGNGGERTWPAGLKPGAWARAQDGKVLVAGRMVPPASGPGLAVVRLRADGDVDTTFGDGGIANLPSQMTPVSESRWIEQQVVVQLDGRILVLTEVLPASYGVIEAMELARLRPDGTPDLSFGLGGVVAVPQGIGAENLVMDALRDGRIRISGDELIYLTETGTPDRGTPTYDPELGAVARHWTLGAPTVDGGRILVSREGESADGSSYLIARLKADGTLDRRLGQQGSGVLTLSGPPASPWTIGGFVCSADGRYLFARLSAGPYRAGLARYLATDPGAGSLDPAFGNGGVVEFGRMDGVGPVIDTADGGVVVAGYPPIRFRLLGVDRASSGFVNVASDQQMAWREDQGPIKLRISRLAGSNGPLRVRYSTADFEPWPTDPAGAATSGIDFESVSGELVWADGDGEDKTISIPLLTDATTETVESLRVELSSLTPGSWVGSELVHLAILDGTAPSPPPTPTPVLSPGSGSGGSGGGGAVGGALLAVLALARALSRRNAA